MGKAAKLAESLKAKLQVKEAYAEDISSKISGMIAGSKKAADFVEKELKALNIRFTRDTFEDTFQFDFSPERWSKFELLAEKLVMENLAKKGMTLFTTTDGETIAYERDSWQESDEEYYS
mgnify:CR=1 FL=1|jgi:hypothetical protein|nr:MAG TPA: hypothetical protein [Caudoviricetes sp.]